MTAAPAIGRLCWHPSLPSNCATADRPRLTFGSTTIMAAAGVSSREGGPDGIHADSGGAVEDRQAHGNGPCDWLGRGTVPHELSWLAGHWQFGTGSGAVGRC